MGADESFERSFESLLESVKAANVKSLVLNVKKYFSANEYQNLINTFPKIKIDEKEDLFIIFVQDLEVIDFKKKIEDKVSEKQQTIVEYSYGGSDEIKENKKVGDFFKNFLDKNTQSNYPLSKRDTSLLIEIQNKKVYLHYDIKFNFIKLNIESTDKYILDVLHFLIKSFITINFLILQKMALVTF